jgi:molecular chaperone DnaJ
VQARPLLPARGNDLLAEVPINVVQALLGTSIRVRTVDGKKVMLRIPPGTQPGRKFRIKGRGWSGTASAGDQLVQIR